MCSKAIRWAICFAMCMMMAGAFAAEPLLVPLDDSQLSSIYAAGFDIRIDFDVDLAAQDPNSVIITGENLEALFNYANEQLSQASVAGGSRTAGAFDETGTYIPNIQNLTQNTLNITDNAMQNAQTLLNIIALNGDVAVGMNLNIIINPTDTNLNITQTNINWANINISDVIPTLPPTVSP